MSQCLDCGEYGLYTIKKVRENVCLKKMRTICRDGIYLDSSKLKLTLILGFFD